MAKKVETPVKVEETKIEETLVGSSAEVTEIKVETPKNVKLRVNSLVYINGLMFVSGDEIEISESNVLKYLAKYPQLSK